MIHSEDGATPYCHPHYDTFRPTPAPIERYLASRYRQRLDDVVEDNNLANDA